MNGYNIVCEAVLINELNRNIVLKKASKKIVKNMIKDPVSLSMLAIPIPTGGAMTVANITQHMARNKSSRKAAALVARKYGLSPSYVIKKIAAIKAKKEPTQLIKRLAISGTISR